MDFINVMAVSGMAVYNKISAFNSLASVNDDDVNRFGIEVNEILLEIVRIKKRKLAEQAARIREQERIREQQRLEGIERARSFLADLAELNQQRNRPKTKEINQIISEKEYNSCSEECSICLDSHTKGKTIVTDCNHRFGKECFQDFEKKQLGSNKCPLCRCKYTQFTGYCYSKSLDKPVAVAAVPPKKVKKRFVFVLENDDENELLA
jgi:hypothetical protein